MMAGETIKSVNRSTSYPSLTLDDALLRLNRLKDSMGLNGNMNRETVASGIGYSTLTGTSARAVAAMASYGLLSRNKDKYVISELGKRYLLPETDGDITNVRRQAALSPRLFAQLYQDFKGQILPKLIGNILAQRYEVQSKASEEVIRIFKATMHQAGLMSETGLLQEVNNARVSTDNEGADGEVTKAKAEKSAETPQDSQITILKKHDEKPLGEDSLNEQGVNHSGKGWNLRVVVRTSHLIDRKTRREIRKFLGAADDLADHLDSLDEQVSHE